MVIRSWNLFHGNTVPAGRRAYLREMIELISAGRPDVVCLQEVPAWALGRLGGWAGMTEVSVLARSPSVGPFRIPAGLGRVMTAPHHGLIRSAFAGQGNAILIAPAFSVVWTANTKIDDGAPGREPRVAQSVDLESPDAPGLVVTNVHCTNSPDPRVCDAELESALRGLRPTPVRVIAGDFNVTPERSAVVRTLGSTPIPGSIDQIIVQPAASAESRVWSDAEREYAGRLLSDHAPVELTVDL